MNVALPVTTGLLPTIVVPSLKVIRPDGFVAPSPVAETEAENVTEDPARTGLGGETVRVVVVGLAGGGGSGSVPPVSARVNSLTLPEKRLVIVVLASPQCEWVVVTAGMVNSSEIGSLHQMNMGW